MTDYHPAMSKVAKWKLEKTKVKVVFRLQFHATHVSLLLLLKCFGLLLGIAMLMIVTEYIGECIKHYFFEFFILEHFMVQSFLR